VFLDRLVRRAISLIAKPSRYRNLRTFAYIAMVCTSSSCRAKTPQASEEHPGQFSVSKTSKSWSIFNARQHSYTAIRALILNPSVRSPTPQTELRLCLPDHENLRGPDYFR
jgi:hypothetical protein